MIRKKAQESSKPYLAPFTNIVVNGGRDPYRNSPSAIGHQVGIEERLGFSGQAVTRFGSCEGVAVFQFDEVHGNACLLKFPVEFLRLRDGHIGILRAVHDQEWRVRFGHMEDRGSATPHLRELGVVSTKEICQIGISAPTLIRNEIGGP